MDKQRVTARPEPLGVVIRTNAIAQPNGVAITEGGTETTWGEFNRRNSQVANGLSSLGAHPGDHVAILSRNCSSMFEILHGSAWAGTIFTPVNWRLAPAEIEYILNDSEAEILFVSVTMWEALGNIRGNLRSIRHVIFFDGGEAPADGLQYFEWREAQSSTPIERTIDPEEGVVQLYTSGTTGRPKGALISHRYFIVAGEMLRDQRENVYELKTGEELLHYMPMFHLGGLSVHYQLAIRGCGMIILQEFDPSEVLRLTVERRIPILYGVPSMLQLLVNDPKMSEADFSHVRYCLYGAAPMPYPLRDKLMEVLGGCGFQQSYGMTEVCFISSLDPEDHIGEAPKSKSVGRVLPGVKIKIVDAGGCELPTGEVGEIATLHPGVMLRYWNLPEATNAAFRDGWYLTGDGGYIDEDGYLFLKDRIKEIVISGGENIYPAEIENVLARHPSVMGVAVVGVADERWGEVPKAFIVLRAGAAFSVDEVHEFAARSLGRFKLPKYYEVIDEFPLTGSGKIMKTRLCARSNDKVFKAPRS